MVTANKSLDSGISDMCCRLGAIHYEREIWLIMMPADRLVDSRVAQGDGAMMLLNWQIGEPIDGARLRATTRLKQIC